MEKGSSKWNCWGVGTVVLVLVLLLVLSSEVFGTAAAGSASTTGLLVPLSNQSSSNPSYLLTPLVYLYVEISEVLWVREVVLVLGVLVRCPPIQLKSQLVR